MLIGIQARREMVVNKCQSVAGPQVIVLCPKNDEKVIKECRRLEVPFFEGPEEDVLTRYYKCALNRHAPYIVRITADCPLLNVPVLFHMMNIAFNEKYDFLTNLPTVDGWDVEIMSFKLLDFIHKFLSDKADREHVVSYVYKAWQPLEGAKFKLGKYPNYIDTSLIPKLSVDTPKDLERVRKIVERMK
jgi:spore coat polysaccharide biosynthesis protein SpsF